MHIGAGTYADGQAGFPAPVGVPAPCRMPACTESSGSSATLLWFDDLKVPHDPLNDLSC